MKGDIISAYKLVSEYGSPLYVFDEEAFICNYNHLLNSFRSIYPKYNIAYSYKTNYTPYICELVKKLGGYAEVVSSMEYQVARKIGYEHSRIIFNGPVKGEELFTQMANGGVVNVDNLEELDLILRYARANAAKEIQLAFRVNIDIEQNFISRFGIDSDNGDLDKAMSLAASEANISLVGLHCHIGRSRSLSAWKNRVAIMLELVDRHFVTPPRFIDLGSGMYSVMEPSLAEQFGGNIPTYRDYAEVVAGAFAEKYGHLPYEQQPELISEPGTTLVSGYLSFLTSVLSIKRVKGKEIATFDGSVGNMGDICKLKKLPLRLYSEAERRNEVHHADFVGYTCLEHDVMYSDYSGPLSVGDIVEFRNVGSYSNVFKPPFITPNCAMIAISPSGETRLMKRRETMEDVFSTYEF